MKVNRKSHSHFVHSSYTSAAALVILLTIISCSPDGQSASHLPADSLLFHTPLIGSETEIRDPYPRTAYLDMNESLVDGWLQPGDGILRFPVELRESPHLMFRLGIESRIPVESGSLELRIEFLPEINESDRNQQEQLRYTIFETTPEDTPYIMYEWVNYDFDLGPYAPANGELRFITEGRLSGNPEIDILWGQPTIYYPSEKRDKNVLLIGVDTLRSDALSLYGGREEISADIARLAESGTIFTNNWSQAPFTGPSFASMLTGKYPSGTAPTISIIHIPEQATTLAEILHPRGYATSMVCGNPYLGSEQSGFTQGMESTWYRNNATPDITVEKLIELIDFNRNRDHFMFLHMMDPHFPYDPPLELVDTLCDRMYDGRYLVEFSDMMDWVFMTESPGETEVERVRELYDAEVADVDSSVGDLFQYLELNGYMENTLIILAADHGEEFFEHNQFGHGQSLYDEMIKLPLIIWGEGFSAGERIDTLVSNIDIAPTILSYLGEPIPDDMPGIPLQEIAADPGFENRLIFGEGNLRRGHHTKYTIEWPYKCITDYFTGTSMLFNLEEDPLELNDLSDQHPDIVGRLMMEGALEMPPLATMFVLLFTGEMGDTRARFIGSVTVPDGLNVAKCAGLVEGDFYDIEGNMVTFDFSPDTVASDPNKAMVIFPARGADTIEIRILADDPSGHSRLFPYGSDIPEPSGHAVVNVCDLPWPNRVPVDANQLPAACYVLGFPGAMDDLQQEFDHGDLDPETLDELRALGYIQ